MFYNFISLQDPHRTICVPDIFYASCVFQIWSVTTGALLDSLCCSDAAVTSLFFYDGFVVSASTAAPCVQLWSLKYDTRHKPPAHIPAGCAHVSITKDADRVFYVRQQSQHEVISWDNNTGQRRAHIEIVFQNSMRQKNTSTLDVTPLFRLHGLV